MGLGLFLFGISRHGKDAQTAQRGWLGHALIIVIVVEILMVGSFPTTIRMRDFLAQVPIVTIKTPNISASGYSARD
jgi:hypothetical protein